MTAFAQETGPAQWPAAAATPADRYPRAAAAYAVQIDAALIWAHEPDAPRPPASLAKLLMALVLLEGPWDPAAPIDIGPRAAAIEGSRAGLRTGERLRAADALTALLLRSANDACVALAEHAAGSLQAFAQQMNARAAAIGMLASHFVHPCGLDAPGQHTTARDLLRLAQAAAAQPQIARIAALPRARIETLGGRRLAFDNGNALVGRIDGVTGLKSGYTARAGKCVIAVAERAGRRVMLVLLDAPNRWWVATGMLEDAFARPAAVVPP